MTGKAASESWQASGAHEGFKMEENPERLILSN